MACFCFIPWFQGVCHWSEEVHRNVLFWWFQDRCENEVKDLVYLYLYLNIRVKGPRRSICQCRRTIKINSTNNSGMRLVVGSFLIHGCQLHLWEFNALNGNGLSVRKSCRRMRSSHRMPVDANKSRYLMMQDPRVTSWVEWGLWWWYSNRKSCCVAMEGILLVFGSLVRVLDCILTLTRNRASLV